MTIIAAKRNVQPAVATRDGLRESRRGSRAVLLVQHTQAGHDSAASSLREGLEETLTVTKLGLSGVLRDFFASTNPIENLIGRVRDVSHNVKRWHKGDMVKRWAGIRLVEASKGFQRIKGHAQMSTLVVALRGQEQAEVDALEKAA